jgi:hypothetical protein
MAAVLGRALGLETSSNRSRPVWPGIKSLAPAALTWFPFWLVVGLELVRAFGAALGLAEGLALWLVGTLFVALASGTVPSETASVMVIVPWRTRIYGIRKNNRGPLVAALAFGLVMGVVAGRVAGLVAGPAFGLAGILAAVLALALGDFLRAGTTSVSAEPPGRLAGREVSAVLTAARNTGLMGGLMGGLAGGLAVGLVAGLAYGLVRGLPAGLAYGLAYGLAFGLIYGLLGGLAPWLYHHWLRGRLARQGLFPRRLRDFLDWCASPGRGWLRVSDAYEFRHRELLEHLADTSGATTKAEAMPNAGG